MMITDKFLRKSADIPRDFTNVAKAKVKKVKLKTKPRTIPKGLLCPPPTLPDKTIGKTGRIQGDKTVTIPAKNAKRIKRSMDKYYIAKAPRKIAC